MKLNPKFMSGAYLINKGAGATSRYVDNYFLKTFGFRKVGHLGTLDPFATGLLVIFVNEATKVIPLFEGLNKTYIATLKLGISTDSGDCDGQIIGTKDIPYIDCSLIIQLFNSMLGKNEQIPPMYSAIKRDGVALYKLAREGKMIERQPREFIIHNLELLTFQDSVIRFRVSVSKGTYIRTLGEDIAKALGTIGHLIGLERVAVGKFMIDDSSVLEDTKIENILEIPDLFREFAQYEIRSDDEFRRVRNASTLDIDSDSEYVLVLRKKEPVAVYKRINGSYVFLRGFSSL